jgi:hypothetical protein
MCHLKPLIYKALTVLQNKNHVLVDCAIFLFLAHFDAIKGGYRENSQTAKQPTPHRTRQNEVSTTPAPHPA